MATAIYRSVGPSATSALQDDDSHADTVAVSSGTATFSSALADNIGVGDVVIVDTGGTDQTIDSADTLLFIAGRTDSTHYTLQTESGATPADISSNDTWQIYRAYTSLHNAEAGTENSTLSGLGFTFTGGNRDLVTNNEQWNIACYANGTTADTDAVTIDGWTTGAQNYLKTYTPVNSNEVGMTQRHSGKWDEGKYRLEHTGSEAVIRVSDEYVRIDGLQLKKISTGAQWPSGILININNTNSDIRISNNVIRADLTGLTNYGNGIDYSWSASSNVKIWNNIIYDWIGGSGGIDHGIRVATGSSYTKNYYVYNNTVYNCENGINAHSMGGGIFVAKNNLSYNNTTDYGGSVFDSSSTNNLSSDGTAPGSNAVMNATLSFVDEANDDFHLAPDDTVARNAGVNLSADPYLNFSDDIDGQQRSGQWSIGADEPYGAKVQVSQATNSNLNINQGLVGYWSFDGSDISGTTVTDLSGNGNDGTINGATPTVGKLGQGLKFNGTSDYVDMGDPSNGLLDMGTSDITLSAWIKPSGLGDADQYFINKKAYCDYGYDFRYVPSTGQVYSRMQSDGGCGGASLSSGPGTVATNVWTHVVAVFDRDGYQRIYVNGEASGAPVDISSFKDVDNSNSQIFNIGNRDGSDFLQGQIDEVRIYNRALTAGEVGELYRTGQEKINAPMTGNTNGLAGYWSFDGSDISGTTVTDLSGNGNDGTINGATPTVGKLGQGLSFNGTSDYVNLSSNPISNFTNANTVCAWALTSDNTYWINSYDQTIVNFYQDSSNYVRFGSSQNTVPAGTLLINYRYNNTTVQLKSPNSLFANNTWNYVCYTWDGSNLALYANGTVLPYTTTGGYSATPGNRIGTRGTSEGLWKGIVDDVRIYSRALTAGEIQDLYNLGHAKIKN